MGGVSKIWTEKSKVQFKADKSLVDRHNLRKISELTLEWTRDIFSKKGEYKLQYVTH